MDCATPADSSAYGHRTTLLHLSTGVIELKPTASIPTNAIESPASPPARPPAASSIRKPHIRPIDQAPKGARGPARPTRSDSLTSPPPLGAISNSLVSLVGGGTTTGTGSDTAVPRRRNTPSHLTLDNHGRAISKRLLTPSASISDLKSMRRQQHESQDGVAVPPMPKSASPTITVTRRTGVSGSNNFKKRVSRRATAKRRPLPSVPAITTNLDPEDLIYSPPGGAVAGSSTSGSTSTVTSAGSARVRPLPRPPQVQSISSVLFPQTPETTQKPLQDKPGASLDAPAPLTWQQEAVKAEVDVALSTIPTSATPVLSAPTRAAVLSWLTDFDSTVNLPSFLDSPVHQLPQRDSQEKLMPQPAPTGVAVALDGKKEDAPQILALPVILPLSPIPALSITEQPAAQAAPNPPSHLRPVPLKRSLSRTVRRNGLARSFIIDVEVTAETAKRLKAASTASDDAEKQVLTDMLQQLEKDIPDDFFCEALLGASGRQECHWEPTSPVTLSSRRNTFRSSMLSCDTSVEISFRDDEDILEEEEEEEVPGLAYDDEDCDSGSLESTSSDSSTVYGSDSHGNCDHVAEEDGSDLDDEDLDYLEDEGEAQIVSVTWSIKGGVMARSIDVHAGRRLSRKW